MPFLFFVVSFLIFLIFDRLWDSVRWALGHGSERTANSETFSVNAIDKLFRRSSGMPQHCTFSRICSLFSVRHSLLWLFSVQFSVDYKLSEYNCNANNNSIAIAKLYVVTDLRIRPICALSNVQKNGR